MDFTGHSRAGTEGRSQDARGRPVAPAPTQVGRAGTLAQNTGRQLSDLAHRCTRRVLDTLHTRTAADPSCSRTADAAATQVTCFGQRAVFSAARKCSEFARPLSCH